MNIIETIYCSQYYELKKSGRDWQKGRLNGTLLSATVIILAVAGIAIISGKFIGSHLPDGLSSSGFSGRFIGRVLGLLLLLVVGGTLSLTYGSQANYNKLILKWEQLPADVLEQTIKSALKIFGITFGLFLVVVMIVVM